MPSPTEEELVAALLEEIEAAFDGVSREDGVSLREAEAIDDYKSDSDCAWARLLDTDSRWQDVPDADIAHFTWVFPFMDGIGGRYYLPAFMSWSLKQYQKSNTLHGHDVLRYLDLCYGDSYLTHYEGLNALQKRAVAHFLQFAATFDDNYGFSEDEGPRSALRLYWSQFV